METSIKRNFFALLFVVGGCQSIQDLESETELARQDVSQTPGLASTEEISRLAASCENEITALYGQRNNVPVLRRREFSLHVGEASIACDHLQKAAEVLRRSYADKETYQSTVVAARQCVDGEAHSSSPVEDIHAFPEATDPVPQTPLVPETSIQTEALVPHDPVKPS